MKTTNSILILVLAFLMIGSMSLFAQTDEEKGQEKKRDRAEIEKAIKSKKIAFITEQLDLTPEEAEKFWPLYNEFENKRNEVTHDLFKRFERGAEKPETITDAEADKIIRQRHQEEQSLLDLKEEYYEKYLNVLSSSQVLKLFEAEDNFRRMLMAKMGRGHENMGGKSAGEGERRGGPRANPHINRHPCK